MLILTSSMKVRDRRREREPGYNKDEEEEGRNERGDTCAAINESKIKEERDEEQLKDKTRCNCKVGVKSEN